MKYLLIMNPGSRGGASRKQFSRIFSILDRSKTKYDYKIAEDLDQAYRLSAENNRAGYDVIAAVGGDGTINRVLNGFYDDKGARVSGTKMGVVYTGTSPDFCKSYRIPVDTEKAVDVLLRNRSVKIQAGRIIMAGSFQDRLDQRPVRDCSDLQSRYFGCCANIGLGAFVAGYANSGLRKILGDTTGTFISLMRAIISCSPGDFTICRDGQKETVENMYNLSVGRTFYLASGIKVKHNLKQGDGRFYNLTVKNIKMRYLPVVLRTIYSGREIVNNNVISLQYSKVIEIYGNTRNPRVELDGDPAGFLPCRIEAAQDMLDLIVEDNNL